MRRDVRHSSNGRTLRHRRSGWILRIVSVTLPLILLFTAWLMRSPPAAVDVPDQITTSNENPQPGAPSAEPASLASTVSSPAEEKVTPPPKTWSRKDLTGKWVLNHSIHRVIDIQPDGTAVMVCTLDYLTSLIYGKELTMNLEWTLDGDLLTHTVVGGTPEKNVKSLTDNFGSSMSYRVLSVDEDQLLLQGPGKSKKQEHWKAVRPASETAEKASGSGGR